MRFAALTDTQVRLKRKRKRRVKNCFFIGFPFVSTVTLYRMEGTLFLVILRPKDDRA